MIYTPAQHLLEQDGLDGSTKKYLQIIKNNAERMQKLISELMEFRKTKSSNMDLHPENVNVKSLMEYASNNYVDILKENKIDFKVETHDTSEIYSDRNALEKLYSIYCRTLSNILLVMDIFMLRYHKMSLIKPYTCS